jgi:hypothetical protein
MQGGIRMTLTSAANLAVVRDRALRQEEVRGVDDSHARLGYSRIVALETEAPNILANLV